MPFRSLAAMALFLVPGSAVALDFTPLPIGSELVVIRATGPIVPGDSERLRRALRVHSGRNIVLSLSSNGGAVLPALEMARIIARLKLPVSVQGNATCESACFILLAASPVRRVAASARIGVHRASLDDRDTVKSRAITDLVARAISDYGVPQGIVRRMERTRPGDMAWLTPAELRQMSVAILGPTADPPR